MSSGLVASSVEDAFGWDTWIGAGAGLLRAKSAKAYVAVDVETILGHERRDFDANQANHHLEAGVRVGSGLQLVCADRLAGSTVGRREPDVDRSPSLSHGDRIVPPVPSDDAPHDAMDDAGPA